MPTPSGPDGVAYKRQYGQMIGARIGQMTSSNALRYIASLRTDPRVAGRAGSQHLPGQGYRPTGPVSDGLTPNYTERLGAE